MNDYKKLNKSLIDFKNKNDQLNIFRRKVPATSEFFFQKLCNSLDSLYGFVTYYNSKKDIEKLLRDKVSLEIKNDSFYNIWVSDMAELSKLFCKFLGDDKISFWVGTRRGCKRYHVDMVPFRLLVTYAGQGTEVLPDCAANRNAFCEGKANEEILRDKSALKFINKWDVAVFRGGEDGILHRTPDSALSNSSSVLMRLDNSFFLKDLIKINNFA